MLVEALKKSFLDRNAVLTDPVFADIPLERLLNKSYAKQLAEEIGYIAEPAESRPIGSDTAYAAVMDSDGNAVSFIQSLYFEFGSAVTAGDTGILIQNRGSFFSLDENHVNTLEPRKRSFHTLMPAMVCKNGKPKILYGTQGAKASRRLRPRLSPECWTMECILSRQSANRAGYGAERGARIMKVSELRTESQRRRSTC